MTECPHCGESLPAVRDNFCVVCREPLDEVVLRERTPQQKAALRAEGKRHLWIVIVGVMLFIKFVLLVLR